MLFTYLVSVSILFALLLYIAQQLRSIAKQLANLNIRLGGITKAINDHAYTVKPSDNAYYPKQISDNLSGIKSTLYSISTALKEYSNAGTKNANTNTRTSSKKSQSDS